LSSRSTLSPAVAAHIGEARSTINRVARSFSLAARLLPTDRRHDVELLYLVLRSLDDLVDVEIRAGGSSREAAEARIAGIERWTRGEPIGTQATDRELIILDHLANRNRAFPRDAVLDFLEGMRADLAGPSIATDDDAARYCYQVAGTVGRMMASLLGTAPGSEAAADRAARSLGSAMQRTNILRDIDEDLAAGRIYLSHERLRAHGIDPSETGGPRSLKGADRRALLQEEIARADAEYEAGLAGIGYLLHGRTSIRAAALLYREILRQIERDGYGSRRPHRPAVGRGRKALLVLNALLNR
jgi:phytoene synthase